MGSPEQNLWSSVLLLAVTDATSSVGCGVRESRKAQSWIGDYPSRDFREICNLAGLDSDAVHDRVHPYIQVTKKEQEEKYAWLKPRSAALPVVSNLRILRP